MNRIVGHVKNALHPRTSLAGRRSAAASKRFVVIPLVKNVPHNIGQLIVESTMAREPRFST